MTFLYDKVQKFRNMHGIKCVHKNMIEVVYKAHIA